MDNKPSLHYHFVYRSLKSLVLENYDLFKRIVNSGSENFKNILINQWKDILKNNPDTFVHTELPDNNPFGLGFITGPDEKPEIFYIEMPEVTIVPEAIGIAIVMYDDYARFFTLEFSNSHIKMQKLGAPSEECQPHFVVGEMTSEGHQNLGKVQRTSEFIAKIKEISKN